jgi:hypothetical protein
MIDPVSVAVAVASLIIGPQAAQIAGPYAAIIVGSFAGCLLALRTRDPSSTFKAGWFIALLMTMSVMLTVGVSLVVSKWTGWDSQWLLFPVSLLLAGAGERWLTVPALAFDALKDAFDAWRSRPGKG